MLSTRFHDIRLALPWSLHWIHLLHVQLGLFSKLGVKKSDEGKTHYASLFWCEHVWNNIISRAICWWLLMHVFTFSVRHYKPRTCYKSLPDAVEPLGTDTMQNQQKIVIVLGSTLKGIVAVTRGLSVGKAERVHGMCWCDTHSWLQYAAVRWRHFWILLLWFVLVLQEQCEVFGMKMTLLGNTPHFALNDLNWNKHRIKIFRCHVIALSLSLSIAFSKRSAGLKASTLRTVGLEFTASRLKTAGAMGKGHMVQGKLASAGAVHCLRNRDTQTLGH